MFLKKSEEKDEGIGLGVIIMIAGVLLFLFMVFTSDNSELNQDLVEEGSGTSKVEILLPPLYLDTVTHKELIFQIPYVYIEGEKTKEYFINLDKRYYRFDFYYEVERLDNAELGVFLNNIMIAFENKGKSYFGSLEGNEVMKIKEARIVFALKKGSLFGTPIAILKDFAMFGYYRNDHKEIKFTASKSNYLLIGKFKECEPGTLIIKVNNCEPYYLNFDCHTYINYDIISNCVNDGKNKIIFDLISGKLDIYSLRLKKN